MKLVWLTDIHLNFLKPPQVSAFFDEVADARPDAVLVTGDIAVGPTVERYMRQLSARLLRPIYFVLGNHDFWGSGVKVMEEAMTALSQDDPHLRWMGAQPEALALTESVGLLGHDGWYDGRVGDYENTPIKLNDFVRMTDFAYQGKGERLQTMQALADAAARFLESRLDAALERFERLLVITHVPPFQQAAWHEGQISGDGWLPFMCSKAVGDVLETAMRARSDRHMTVLCGHTHGAGEVEILPNLLVKTGGADYYKPALQEPFEL